MRLIYYFLLFPLTLSFLNGSCNRKSTGIIQPVDYMDPMIGTDFFGHTYPGATRPYAMVQLSPDNGTDGWTFSSGYAYKENTIIRRERFNL